jgi:hypothetical protein
MNEIKCNLVVTVKITGDLGCRLRSHLLDNVEQLFNFKTMLAGNRVCEVIKLRLTVFTPVLLGIIYIASSLNYHVTLVVDTCHPLARGRNGDTQNTTLVMTGRLEQTLRTPLIGQ